ncbi:WG repeat-containing protein [Clostridium nigeriense]|uniref:WG repeat-containing protein n=1 Tax=Clostridium nigeriense TaxID=1805470 RepID=UPI000829945B|nr:WG repeat-containing protein [Clostridium nigeriense]
MKRYIKIILLIIMSVFVFLGCSKDNKDKADKDNNVKLYPVLEEKSGLYGYVDINGDYKIEPKFYDAETFSGDYAKVYINKDRSENIINSKGNYILPEDKEFINITMEDDFIITSTKEFKYSIYNENGEKILEDEYDSFFVDENGLIVVLKDTEKAIFNDKGKVVVPFKSNESRLHIQNKYIIWNEDNTSIVANLKGKEILRIDDNKGIRVITDNTIVNEDSNGKYNLYTIKGEKITEDEYDYIGFESDGLIGVVKDGKSGFINEKGEEEIPCIYESALPFSDGYTVVSNGGKYGIIDKDNNAVIDIKYDGIIDKTETLDNEKGSIYKYVIDERVAVIENDRTYLVNLEGKRATSSYDNIQFYNDYIIGTVTRITESGFAGVGNMIIDKDDNILSKNLAVMGIVPYDLMIVNEKEGNEGYIINSKGEILNNNLYGVVSFGYSEGYDSFVTTKGDGWAVISKDGHEIISFDDKVESVKIYDEGLYYLNYKDGKVDLVNREGKSILD